LVKVDIKNILASKKTQETWKPSN